MSARLPTIAMITDFGHRDGFIGAMAGTMLSVTKAFHLIDVAHDIPPQDTWHAAWVLDQVIDNFPSGTFFLCVVDPNVGDADQRRLILYLEEAEKCLVLPDNGLATRILKRFPKIKGVSIQNPAFFRNQESPSKTFHGRDIYAPVTAHLAKAWMEDTFAATMSAMGPEIMVKTCVRFKIKPPQKGPSGEIMGQIDTADVYGNLITNIPWAMLDPVDLPHWKLFLNQDSLPVTKVPNYTAGKKDQIILVEGSHGNIEISIPKSNAKSRLKARAGLAITLSPDIKGL